MDGGMFNDLTMRLVKVALDGLALRQQVTSNNIANVETPGFKASVVTFEDQLQRVLAPQKPGERGPATLQLVRTHPAHLTTEGNIAEVLEPRVVRIANTTGRNDQNNVDIDREMITLADTAIQYRALIRLLSKHFAMLRATITEGRS